MIRPFDVIQAIRKRYIDMLSVLDERGRRLFVAAEARAYGLGGAYVVEQATGVARSTINRGIAELKANPPPTGRVRRVGGGRKKNDPVPGPHRRSEECRGFGDARRSDESVVVDIPQLGACDGSSQRNWLRAFDLCGPLDIEVSRVSSAGQSQDPRGRKTSCSQCTVCLYQSPEREIRRGGATDSFHRRQKEGADWQLHERRS